MKTSIRYVVVFGGVCSFLVFLMWHLKEPASLHDITSGDASGETKDLLLKQEQNSNVGGVIMEVQTKNRPDPVGNSIFECAGIKLPVKFEEVNGLAISKRLQEVIVEDLNFVYAHFKFNGVVNSSARKLTLNGKEVVSNQVLHISSDVGVYPNVHVTEFGMVAAIDGVECLVISAGLISAYQKAFDFRENHSEAFAKLEETIRILSSDKSDRFNGLSFEDIVWMPAGNAVDSETKVHILNELQNVTIRRPGVLDAQVVDSSDPLVAGLPHGALFAKGLFVHKGVLTPDYAPLIYRNGRWLLVIGG